MAIHFQIPPDLERNLRTRFGNLDEAAKEAMAVELFRQGELTHFEFSQVLGVSRLETESILKRHDVTEDLLTVEEFRQDLDGLDLPETRQ